MFLKDLKILCVVITQFVLNAKQVLCSFEYCLCCKC